MFDRVLVREAWGATSIFSAIVGVLAGGRLVITAIWLPGTLGALPNVEDALLAVPALALGVALLFRRTYCSLNR
jgi:hypothetical protein